MVFHIHVYTDRNSNYYFLFLAGYSIVDLIALNPGTQIVFIVAMYISVYPVAISMRNSNVYQVIFLFVCLFVTHTKYT